MGTKVRDQVESHRHGMTSRDTEKRETACDAPHGKPVVANAAVRELAAAGLSPMRLTHHDRPIAAEAASSGSTAMSSRVC